MDCENNSRNLWDKQKKEKTIKKYSSLKYSWHESEMEVMSMVNNFWW